MFRSFDSRLVLSETGKSRSVWLLPSDFMPGSRPALTYHQSLWRWTATDDRCRLQSASKGQEFVLNLGSYPEVQRWAEAKVLLAA